MNDQDLLATAFVLIGVLGFCVAGLSFGMWAHLRNHR